MTRFLAAPLLFGTVSPRQLWHAKGEDEEDGGVKGRSASMLTTLLPFMKKEQNVLKTIAEGREWHRLLAARNMRFDPSYSKGKCSNNNNNDEKENGVLRYKYWRWHGFLCRYGVSTLTKGQQSTDNPSNKKDGIVLVHGFGASGSQFGKTINELSKQLLSSISVSSKSKGTTIDIANDAVDDGLVTDLISFGQCEKPPLTYTQYLWSSQISSFTKEICLHQKQCAEFVLGGNSIGGYTAMMSAADDTLRLRSDRKKAKKKSRRTELSAGGSTMILSSSGAPGTGRCNGLILLNSAGQIRSKEDVDDVMMNLEDELEDVIFKSVAEITASDGLGKCSPPPRTLTKLGGNGLLWYLRPRIQEICKNVYPANPSAVDDILCENILRDSLDLGAINVMISGSKLPPAGTANELLGANFGSKKKGRRRAKISMPKTRRMRRMLRMLVPTRRRVCGKGRYW